MLKRIMLVLTLIMFVKVAYEGAIYESMVHGYLMDNGYDYNYLPELIELAKGEHRTWLVSTGNGFAKDLEGNNYWIEYHLTPGKEIKVLLNEHDEILKFLE